MESLLRLSGLLSEDDNGKTDLGTLEKRLADRTNGLNAARNANKFNIPSATQQQSVTSHSTTPRVDSQSSPHTAATTPASQKESETEVEELSDMMCSLVTNNCGETRYIGRLHLTWSEEGFPVLTSWPQVRRRVSLYSLRRAFNGLTKKPATHLSKI